jgi:hypothetical protein
MPQMADLSLSDGTTARIFAALNPAGGDRSPAFWRWEDTAKVPAVRPWAQAQSRFNSDRTARHLDLKLAVPYFVTDGNGVQVLRNTLLHTSSTIVPLAVPDASLTPFVNFVANLYAAALTKSMLSSGYAAS